MLVAHSQSNGALEAELLWDVKARMPATRLILLGKQDMVRAVDAGAMACLDQDASPAELLETIRDVSRGCPGCSMSLLTRLVGSSGSQVSFHAPRRAGRSLDRLICNSALEAAILRPAERLHAQRASPRIADRTALLLGPSAALTLQQLLTPGNATDAAMPILTKKPWSRRWRDVLTGQDN